MRETNFKNIGRVGLSILELHFAEIKDFACRTPYFVTSPWHVTFIIAKCERTHLNRKLESRILINGSRAVYLLAHLQVFVRIVSKIPPAKVVINVRLAWDALSIRPYLFHWINTWASIFFSSMPSGYCLDWRVLSPSERVSLSRNEATTDKSRADRLSQKKRSRLTLMRINRFNGNISSVCCHRGKISSACILYFYPSVTRRLYICRYLNVVKSMIKSVNMLISIKRAVCFHYRPPARTVIRSSHRC